MKPRFYHNNDFHLQFIDSISGLSQNDDKISLEKRTVEQSWTKVSVAVSKTESFGCFWVPKVSILFSVSVSVFQHFDFRPALL